MFTVGRGWKGWFVERVSDAGVVSPGSPGGSRHFLRSCWIFLTTVVTLSCVASVCFTYFVKWANTTATNFLVALIYILTNAFCLWSIGCIVCHLVIGYVIVDVASLSGGYEMIWRMNIGSVRAEMWDSNQIHSKGGSAKSQWVDINVLYFCYYTRYIMLLHVDFFLERQTHSRHGARSIIEFFLLTLWFHIIRHLAFPRSLLLQTFTIVYLFFPYRLCSTLLER